MPIKLLALDIDGTLLTSRGQLTPGNQEAIEKARRSGVEVVLLTGRRFGSAYQLLQELKLDVPLVAHNGALTKDIRTLETLDLQSLAVEAAREIIRIARRSGADMICCCDEPGGLGKMVIEGISEDNHRLQRYLEKYRDALIEVEDLIDFVEHPPIQIMFSGRCAQMDEFASDLENSLAGQIRLFRTRYAQADMTILDAVSTSASKGASLAAIASRMSLTRDQVMAIGDNHNDLTMLEFAGTAVIMANAEDELKQMGFAETLSNEQSGVADAIEKFIFEN